MKEEPAERYARALRETIGWEGRMISYSKTGYHERHPDHVPIFNANICVHAGKVWQGDLDLTADEDALVALARRIGETVYVLYEHHGRFDSEDDPLLAQAVYSVTNSGHTRFDHRYVERAADGTLRMRPSPPRSRKRLRWQLLLHRPRLLRFWVVERKSQTARTNKGIHSTLLYLGARDGGKTPLLVLGLTRGKRLRILACELTWYPSGGIERSAPRELIKLAPEVKLGRFNLWGTATVWPARVYSIHLGYQTKPRWR